MTTDELRRIKNVVDEIELGCKQSSHFKDWKTVRASLNLPPADISVIVQVRYEDDDDGNIYTYRIKPGDLDD
jgi:hypothetical protein